jgi:predicted metalloendopeptidase
MVALETMLRNKVDQWKAYMRWSLLNRASSQLSTDIENANFEFTENLNGAVSQRPVTKEHFKRSWNGWRSFRKLYVEKNFRLRPKPKQKK